MPTMLNIRSARPLKSTLRGKQARLHALKMNAQLHSMCPIAGSKFQVHQHGANADVE